MTNPPSGDTPDPYPPPPPYGPVRDPTEPFPTSSPVPEADLPTGDAAGPWPPADFPAGYQPAPGYPTAGQPAPGYSIGSQAAPEVSPYPGVGPVADDYPPPYQGGSQPYHTPPGYGGVPGYGYVGPQRRTNPLAIAALACALGGLLTCISAPVGVVLGHVARRQIRQTGEQGDGMVTAALWIGYILTFIGVLVLLAWLALAVYAINHNGG